jgi:signal transduction histidine kinase
MSESDNTFSISGDLRAPLYLRWRPDGTILASDASTAAFFGRSSPVELVGLVVDALFADPHATAIARAVVLARLDAGRPSYIERPFRRPGGTVWLLWAAVPLRDSTGALVAIDSYGLDVTPLRNLAATLEGANTVLSTLRRDERTALADLISRETLEPLIATLWELDEGTRTHLLLSDSVRSLRSSIEALRTLSPDAPPPARPADGMLQVPTLGEFELMLAAVLTSARETLMLYGEDGTARFISPSYRELFGDIDVVADPLAIASRMSTSDLHRVTLALFSSLDGLAQDPLQWTYHHPSGAELTLETRFAPLRLPYSESLWVTTTTSPHPLSLLEDARRIERRRLGSWLHDEPIQQLVALEWTLPDELRIALEPVTLALRAHATALRSELSDQSLSEALQSVFARCLTPLSSHADPAVLDTLPLAIAEVVLRVVQEGLRNIDRHAEATRAAVSIEMVDSEVRVSVTDDGLTTPEELTERLRTTTSIGLRSLAEDVDRLGGSLQVLAASPGLRILATLPRAA